MGMDATATARFVKVAGTDGHFWRSDADAAKIRSHIRSLGFDGRWKTAVAGGAPEEGFEQAFSSLAYAYMKDKAPRLLDFMVGFQLVDRNEDNTKAMAVFGFKIGDQWLYAPVFFLNGDLKGHEILYVKNQDIFVPLKENWVNYLMSRKPHVLGEGSPQDTYQLGGLQADIFGLSIPPNVGIGKRGSDKRAYIDDWAKPVLPVLAAFKTASAKSLYKTAKPGTQLALTKVAAAPTQAALRELAGVFDMNNVLPKDFGLLKSTFELTQHYPGIKMGFDRFYGPDCFLRWGREVQSRVKKASQVYPIWELEKKASPSDKLNSLFPETVPPEHPVKSGALRIYVYESVAITKNLDELDDKERERLLKDTVLIKDKRDPHGPETSKAYNTQVRQDLSNPHESGIYEILEKPGSFARMLVISHPLANNGSKNFSTVVRLSDGNTKSWLNAHSSNLWMRSIEDVEEFRKWWDKLGDKDSLKKGGTYIAINERGNGSVPFEVREVYGDGAYKVDFKGYDSSNFGRQNSLPKVHEPDEDCHTSMWGAKLMIEPEGKNVGSKLRAIKGDLRVPAGFKFLKLQDPPEPKKPGEWGPCCITCCESGSEDKPIEPGDLSDIQMMFSEKTAALKLITDHNEVTIKTAWAGDQRLRGIDALVSLVRDHGFTEKVAREMLKQAEYKGSEQFRVQYAPGFGDMVKSAQPNTSVLAGGPNAPPMMPPELGVEQMGRNSVQATYPDEQFNMVSDLDSSLANYQPQRDIWQNYTREDFENTMNQAQQAAQSGQKEIFDTSMIGGMLKSINKESLVDKYLGPLSSALDKICRIYFTFLWHPEEFEDRYGKSDMDELSQALVNNIDGLGDLVLFLKQRSIDTGLSRTSTAPDIESVANI